MRKENISIHLSLYIITLQFLTSVISGCNLLTVPTSSLLVLSFTTHQHSLYVSASCVCEWITDVQLHLLCCLISKLSYYEICFKWQTSFFPSNFSYQILWLHRCNPPFFFFSVAIHLQFGHYLSTHVEIEWLHAGLYSNQMTLVQLPICENGSIHCG